MDIFVKPSVPLVRYLKVLMISVYENNRDTIEEGEGITFWCLYNALNEGHKTEIKEIADMYGQKVEFIYGDVSIFDVLPSPAPWPQTIYFGLLAHQFLPESLHRVLYLDIDVAVNGNLKEFYNLPFDDNYLIASRDWYDARYEPEEEFKEFTCLSEIKEADLLGNGAFNCGVLLFNLDKFRSEKIDIEFYNKKLYGKKVKLADQSILGYCFYNKVKLLTTCKYNYRIGYSMVSMRQWKSNYYYNKYYHYEFSAVTPKIVHYCGQIGFKPWYARFKASELDVNRDFYDITPEYADYVDIWWRYAEKSPDYTTLLNEQKLNKVAYDTVKKLLKGRPGPFINSMYLATLTVPDYADRNTFRKNDDINRYVRPGIYSCLAATKPTLKNLPAEFMEESGFRLTVKSLSSEPTEKAPLVQELEVADSSATVYRRYVKNRDGVWTEWTNITAFPEIRNKINDVQVSLKSDIEVKIAKLGDDLNCKVKAESESLHTALSSQVGLLADLEVRLNNLNEKYNELLNSKSFKLGRALTYIPRKICGIFKKKK